MMLGAELLPIGEVAHRAGVAPSALRYYERVGLLEASRSSGGQRRYPRSTLRRLAFIRAAQNVGLSLDEIKSALATLPEARTPTVADWTRLSRTWRAELGLSLENFVGLVAERQVLSFLRSGRRNPWKEAPLLFSEELELPALESDPEEDVLSRENLALLLDRVREEVSPMGWGMFDLLFIQELSQAEVEAATSLSADAVYAWRSRLRRLCQRLLTELSGSEGPERKT